MLKSTRVAILLVLAFPIIVLGHASAQQPKVKGVLANSPQAKALVDKQAELFRPNPNMGDLTKGIGGGEKLKKAWADKVGKDRNGAGAGESEIAKAQQAKERAVEKYKRLVRDKAGYSKQVEAKRSIEGVEKYIENLKNGKVKIKSNVREPLLQFSALKATGDFGMIGEGIVVVQVIDKKTAIIRMMDRRKKDLYWIELDTSDVVDGKEYWLKGLVECVGTKRYTTVTGATHTVQHLRMY